MADIPVEGEAEDRDSAQSGGLIPPQDVAEPGDPEAVDVGSEAVELTGVELLRQQLQWETARQVALTEELQTAYRVEMELRDELDVLRGLKPIAVAPRQTRSLAQRGLSFLRNGGKTAKVKRRIKKVGRKVPYAGKGYRAVRGALRSVRGQAKHRPASKTDTERTE